MNVQYGNNAKNSNYYSNNTNSNKLFQSAFNYFHRSPLFNQKPIRPIKNLLKANDECSSHF